MKTRTLMITALAVLLCSGGIFAWQAHAARGGSPSRVRGLMAQRLVEKLGLSDDQVAAIKLVRNAEKDVVLKKLSEFHQARIELRNTIQNQGDKVDEKAVRAAQAKVAKVESDLAVERARIYAKIGPILTDEQIDQVKDLQARMDEHVDWFLKNIGSHPALND